MPWQQLTLFTTLQQADPISELLTNFGSLSISLEDNADQPLFEPKPGEMPLWHNVKITALFSADTNLNGLIFLLEQSLQSYQLTTLAEQDWQQQLQQQFQPIKIGNKLCITPTWHEITEKKRTHVILDPGLAFGTGSHPTTKLCLEWLEKNIHDKETILDYGCGSGILAISALKLGASAVYAVDHDPQALLSTKANAALNKVNVLTYLPDQLPNIKTDIIIANIFANCLLELAPLFHHYIKKNGIVVLSGILENQMEAIKKAYSNYFNIKDCKQLEEWFLMELF